MEISEIRDKIDALDSQILELFLMRMELAEKEADYKNQHHFK